MHPDQVVTASAGSSAEPLILVYLAVNRINGKRYIGMTARGLRIRMRGHKSQLKSLDNQTYITKAMRKHGFENFEFSVLEVCPDVASCLQRERELISKLKPEYNTASGGLTGPQGWVHSEETRRRMSEARARQVPPWLGKKRSAESIAKMVATRSAKGIKPMLGKKHSAETIAKIKATRPFLPKPRPLTPEELEAKRALCLRNSEAMSKPVRCLNDGLEFKSRDAASRHYSVAKSVMARWCNGETKSKRGLRFEYI